MDKAKKDLFLIPTVAPTEMPTPTLPIPFSADRLFQLVNDWRVKEGYQPYIESEFACNVASKRLPEVEVNWSHEGFYYGRFCKDCWLAENLADSIQYYSEEHTLSSWLKSASHAANLKTPYTHSCIECSSGYCVHIFSYF